MLICEKAVPEIQSYLGKVMTRVDLRWTSWRALQACAMVAGGREERSEKERRSLLRLLPSKDWESSKAASCSSVRSVQLKSTSSKCRREEEISEGGREQKGREARLNLFSFEPGEREASRWVS